MSWKPAGYPEVSPYLVVENAVETIAFLDEVLGETGGEWQPVPGFLHVYVDDVDAIYRRALERGAVAVQEPVRHGDDPDRRGGFRDPGGNTWWVATQVHP